MNEQPRHDRRSFLKSVGVTGGAAALLSEAAVVAGPAGAAVAASNPGLPSGEATFFLSFQGLPAAPLQSAKGGHRSAEMVVDDKQPDVGKVHKHLAGVKYEDIVITAGPGMGPGLGGWLTSIMELIGGDQITMDGDLTAVTKDLMTHSTLSFSGGLMTEVTFPALDAASKDAAKMTIKITPESTRFQKHHDKWTPPSATAKQKKWLCANFRLRIDGLDCSRVSKVSAITVKQKVVDKIVATDVAQEPDYGPSNVTIMFPDTVSQQFYDWFEAMLADGEANEKHGSIQWYAQDRKTLLGTLDLGNLGLLSVIPDVVQESNSVRRIKAEMYVEYVKLDVSPMI